MRSSGLRPAGEHRSHRPVDEKAQLNRDDPITVPITAIFTKRDGVVDWRACIDRFSADVNHVEVGSTHVGMGLDPDVWMAAADGLT